MLRMTDRRTKSSFGSRRIPPEIEPFRWNLIGKRDGRSQINQDQGEKIREDLADRPTLETAPSPPQVEEFGQDYQRGERGNPVPTYYLSMPQQSMETCR